MALEERMRSIERKGKNKLEQKLLAPAMWDNGIKTAIVCYCV